MKISAIPSYNIKPLSFKSTYDSKIKPYEDDEELRHFGDDDQSDIRDAIRDHYLASVLPGYDFNTAKNRFNPRNLDDVYIQNFAKIGNHSCKGASLAKNLDYVRLLDNSGIYTVIDLVGYDDLKYTCAANNVSYHSYPVGDDYWANPMFADNDKLIEDKKKELESQDLSDEEYDKQLGLYETSLTLQKKEFMRKFIDLVDIVNEGHFYIGCEYGSFRTPNILALATLFNPEWIAGKSLPTDTVIVDFMKNMYNNLTPEDKIRLRFTPKYEQDLEQYLFE